MARFLFVVLSVLCLLPPNLTATETANPPLRTSSRWIVDGDGVRVKLSCLSWPSHPEAAVAEGLSSLPVGLISGRIASAGFNCVRLSFPLLLAGQSQAPLNVRQSLQRLGLVDSIAGFRANNPSMLDLPLISAYQLVVSSLAENNLMVILDGSDELSNPESWVMGLTRMASIFNGVRGVVGVGLSNGLGRPKQNAKDWYRYMQKGAEAVHSANPDVLIIISGLGDGRDLSFLLNQHPELPFTGKLVLEVYSHGPRAGKALETANPGKVCQRAMNNLMKRGGALLQKGWPLMVVTELGADDNNHLINCFLGLVSELDLDWALATETKGLTNLNSVFLMRLSILQGFADVAQTKRHNVLLHPPSGQCVLRKSLSDPLKLGPCSQSDAWSYTPQKTLTVKGTYFCLQAVGVGELVKFSIVCNIPGTSWEILSGNSKAYMSAELGDGTTVCLDADSQGDLVSETCKCSSRNGMSCDPGSQWFEISGSYSSSPTHILRTS